MNVNVSSKNAGGLWFPAISIIVAALVFHLNLDSRIPGLILIMLGSVLAGFEIFRAIVLPANSAIANGNVWVLTSLLLIFIIAPAVRIITNAELPPVFAALNPDTNVNQVNSLAAIAIFATILGSRAKSHSFYRLPSAESTSISSEDRPSVPLSIVILIFWSFLYIYWAFSQGNPVAAIFGSRNTQQLFGIVKSNGYLVDSLYGALGVSTAWLAYAVKVRNRPLILKISIACLLFLIPSILQGDRSKFIFYLLVISIILTAWNRKIPRRYILLAAILIPLLVVAPRIYRETDVKVSNLGSNAFSASNLAETFTKEDTAMAPTLSILINNLGTNIHPQYGLSYLNLVAKPIPRSLWPGKPIEFDTQIMRIIFPKYAAAGVGFAFSAISEPLVNFGIAGVIGFFILLGVVNKRLLDRMRFSPSAYSIFLNAWIAGFMFVLIRGNLTVDFQRAVFPLLSGLAVLRLQEIREKRRGRV